MKLVFIHGRSQEDKDPLVLRQRWVVALREGLAEGGLELPIDERDIVFPYFGDALRDVTSETPNSLSTVRFPLKENAEHVQCEVLQECLEGIGINDATIFAKQGGEHDEENFLDRLSNSSLSNEWVQRGLRLMDLYVPRASAKSMESTAADVTQYLSQPEVRGYIDNGVSNAFEQCEDDEVVVVGHSLGSIVAYSVLRDGGPVTRPVRALITIGSPLGLRIVREAFAPIGYPPKVESWFNAYDERDIIALNPLDQKYFPVTPSIKNFGGVQNESDNHHKIRGYLSDRVVATSIVQALRGD